MINNGSSSVGTCSVSSASLSKGETRISDVQGIDKKIASIRHTHRFEELISLLQRRHKKMEKLQKLNITLDKYNKTNNKDKRARVDKLKKDINIKIKNYDNLGLKNPPMQKPPMQMIQCGTSSRPEQASSNPTTPMDTIPRVASTQTRVASTQTGAASTQTGVASTQTGVASTQTGVASTQTRVASTQTRVASSRPTPKATPTTNKASGKADPRISELQALRSDFATLKENASGSGSRQGDRDYQNNARQLKRRIEKLEIELAASVVDPKRVTPTISQEDADLINAIDIKIFELNNMDRGSTTQAYRDYQKQKPKLKREIEELKSKLPDHLHWYYT
ncbi:hypothetical protein [Vibrio aestuarianus]|uniref:hypothetical protein n=1 Tax=Vibrio aestuarianus TaxID=28171 RepID=UPI0021C2BDD7|nr:hypothetical protein [Vibrio aestuarianus]CAH8194579.1 exported hypothetical protein [Vibrio aestuarianus]